MYGELNIKPWELHRYTFRDVLLSIDGLNDKRIITESITRKSTYIIAASFSSNIPKVFKKLWPDPAENVVKDDWVARAKKLLKSASEYDDRKKAGKLYNDKVKVSNLTGTVPKSNYSINTKKDA